MTSETCHCHNVLMHPFLTSPIILKTNWWLAFPMSGLGQKIIISGLYMGADAGGTGDASPPVQNSKRDVPQKLRFLQILKKELTNFFYFFQNFQNKVAEIRGEIRIWGWVGLTDQNPFLPSQNFVAAPLGLCHCYLTFGRSSVVIVLG